MKKFLELMAGYVERYLGYDRFISWLLVVPIVPDTILIAEKIRYFDRRGMSQHAYAYISRLLKKRSFKVASKLPVILNAFRPEMYADSCLLADVLGQKKMLDEYRPKTAKEVYSKIAAQIRCFNHSGAMRSFSEYQHWLSNEDKQAFTSYAKQRDLYVGWFQDVVDEAWVNTFVDFKGALREGGVAFYIPPVLKKLSICPVCTSSFYVQVVELYKNLYSSFPGGERLKIVPFLQFDWRNAGVISGFSQAISYHTKVNNGVYLNVKESALSGYFTIDAGGYSGWHSASNISLDEIRDIVALEGSDSIEGTFRGLFSEFVEKSESKYFQFSANVTDFSALGEFYFLPMQVTNDVVAGLAEIDTYQLLCEMVNLARKHDLTIVVKKHPKCRSALVRDLLEKVSTCPNVILSSDSVHKIIPYAKAVITVNSGVGMEALLHLKTVITTGGCDYRAATYAVNDVSGLEKRLLNFKAIDPDDIKRFLHYFLRYHLYRYDDVNKIKLFWGRALGLDFHENNDN
ncbi:hypothetical protein [Pseudomaricurvus sp. HS19]|uniref:capsular polysaccharide export protein, LipB/KpsS family n=1 Tax=Pseudomaricurvus sp. HS19 TaxID=2692626 RepID=UPI00136FCD56|nr:hypothetical protein [Pseudomaricurvus sp. HS19]MYM64709.1 hypothetical protein [Pseudomaricurvus sp. HS19]